MSVTRRSLFGRLPLIAAVALGAPLALVPGQSHLEPWDMRQVGFA